MKRRKLTLRILSLLLAVTMIMSNSVIVHAVDGIAPFVPGGAYGDEDIVQPPVDIGGTLETYPGVGKSDNPSDIADIVGTDKVSGDRKTDDVTNLGEEEASQGITGSNKIGAHSLSIPALFVIVKNFDYTSSLDLDIKQYLVSTPLSADELTNATKFISKETIKTYNYRPAIKSEDLQSVMDKCGGGYIIEDLFYPETSEIERSTVTEVQNMLLGYLVRGSSISTNSSAEYQKLADVLLAYNVGGTFNQETVTRIDSIADSGTVKEKSVPVILIYNGFLNYTTISGTSSSWKTYADQFGINSYTTGYSSIKEYESAAVSMATAEANEDYGSAASIAFNTELSIDYAGSYYNKNSATNAKDGLAGINNVKYGTKNHYSRTYLTYGNSKTGIGAKTDFTFNVRTTSGVKSSNGKFTAGSSMPNYEKACGFFEIGFGGDQKTLKCVSTSTRDWDVTINVNTGYINSSISPICKPIVDSVELRSNSTNEPKALFSTPNIESTSDKSYLITLKLTQEEMDDIVGNKYKIALNVRPQYGSVKTASKIYAPFTISVLIKDPRSNRLKSANPIPTKSSNDPKYATGGMCAYHYCSWTKTGSTVGSGKSGDSVEAPTVTIPDESDGILDLSRMNNNSSDGVLDLSKLGDEVTDESEEMELDVTISQSERITSENWSSVPWSFTFTGTDAYAEIVANEIGYVKNAKSNTTAGWAQDWSVLAGIPSTENVAVGVGGTQYQVTAAGFINTEENITRHVNIVMQVTNGWGPPGSYPNDNYPCKLSEGHTAQCPSASSWTTPCSSGGANQECSHCHEKTWVPNTTWVGDYGICYSEPGGEGECGTWTLREWVGSESSGHYVDTPGKTHHGHYSIDCEHCKGGESVTYHCGTGGVAEASDSGNEELKIVSRNLGDLKYGQYSPGWVKVQCKWEKCTYGTATDVDTKCVDKGRIDEGYTYADTYGCKCSDNWNMEHEKNAYAAYSYDELIPTASFKEITSMKITALGYSELTELDSNLYGTQYIGNSAGNSNIMGVLWRGCQGLANGSKLYETTVDGIPVLSPLKGGHLWYTQFANATYSKSEAWATMVEQGPYYFFTDCTIYGDIACDSRWDAYANTNGNIYDDNIGSEDYIRNYGETYHQYHDEAWNSRTGEEWKHRKLTKGSLCLSESSLCKIAMDAMNAWLYTNRDLYKANIISDFLVMGESQGSISMQNGYQNVIADFHAVDEDEGIPLFGYNNENYWTCREAKIGYWLSEGSPTKVIAQELVTHNCKPDQVDGLLTGAYSEATGYEPLVGGYIGITDYNTIYDKYRFKGEEGSDYIACANTCFPFFLWDRWTMSAYGSGGPMPTTGGIKLAANPDTMYMPSRGSGPYGQWLWPDTYNEYAPAWDKPGHAIWGTDWYVDGRDKYTKGDGIEATGGVNHYNQSGYTSMQLIINGRRSEDFSRGLKPEKAEGYYRRHNYNYVGDDMYLYSYSNCCPYGEYYNKWHDNINNNGNISSLEFSWDWFKGKKMSPSYTVLALAHNNIDLNNRAPNGVYNNSMTVTNHYVTLTDFDTPGCLTGTYNHYDDVLPEVLTCKYSDSYTNTAGQSNVINDVIIHDPISVESCQVIGNNYGNYADGVDMNIDNDGRVYQDEKGNWYQKTDNKIKDNYAVVGNEFHVWVTDFGDFYDESGSWSNNSATLSRGVGGSPVDVSNKIDGQREPYSGNPNYRGYQNSMDTNTWIWDRLISFNFPVSYVNQDGKTVAVGSNTFINLDDVPALTDNGSKGYVAKRVRNGYLVNDTDEISVLGGNLFHYGSPELQSARSDDLEFVFGLDYVFTVLPSALETDNGEVTVWARSINTTSKESEMNPKVKAKQAINLDRDSNYKAEDVVSKTMEIDIVGRIGNLAMTDCGDFRYSNLFKRATGDWLIQGVIQKVNLANPKTILSTKYDILGNDCTSPVGYSHGTLSATNWLFAGNVYGGKSATYVGNQSANSDVGTVWNYLPLVSSMNPIEEYQKDQMRMGYLAYMDIETIGNYYGYNFKHDNNIDGVEEIDRGPIAPGEKDTRKYVMTILPKYYLYDYEQKKWIGINIYSGSAGNRDIFYRNGEYVEDKNAAALYIDLTNDKTNVNSERDRRCVTKAEQLLTRLVTAKAISNGNLSVAHSALESEDYIGTSSRIVLDQFDRNFIGTSFRYNAVVPSSTNENEVHIVNSVLGYMFDGIDDFKGSTWYLKEDWKSLHERVNDLSFTEQSQRWYFSIGLPSSAYITYPSAGDNQYDIEKSHEKLMEEHPNSVVVTFLDIKVQGDPWTLQYDVTNNSHDLIKFDLFNPNNLPDDWDEENWETTVIINPNDPPTVENPGGPPTKIDPKWPPVIVYDKELTSATDWSTQGTH